MVNIDSCVSSIENIFFEYLSKKTSDTELCKRLSQALSAADLNGKSKEFEVALIDGRSEFLGMCVYPDMYEYSRVILDANGAKPNGNGIKPYDRFCNSWFLSIHKFYVEIDKNMFDRRVINFTPQELTAMLLHELSHVVYSDKTTEKLYRAYQVHKAELAKKDPGLTKLALSTLYIIPGMIACTAHKANTGRYGMKEEYICDKVFGLKNYQEHLGTALDKIIRAYGTKFVLDDGTSDKELDASMKWVDFNVDNLIARRDAIGREVVNMASNTRSKYAKNAFLNITKTLGIGARDRYTGRLITMEAALEDVYSGAIESSEFFVKYDFVDDVKAVAALEMAVKCGNSPAMESVLRPKLPNGFDIDSISIEVDRVRNHADRIYVLDLIYAQIEKLDEFEEHYSGNTAAMNKYKPTIDRYRERLDEYRTRLLNRRDLGTTYKVFAKCPAGYEG